MSSSNEEDVENGNGNGKAEKDSRRHRRTQTNKSEEETTSSSDFTAAAGGAGRSGQKIAPSKGSSRFKIQKASVEFGPATRINVVRRPQHATIPEGTSERSSHDDEGEPPTTEVELLTEVEQQPQKEETQQQIGAVGETDKFTEQHYQHQRLPLNDEKMPKSPTSSSATASPKHFVNNRRESTMEFGPCIDFYRDSQSSLGAVARPSMMDLVEGSRRHKQRRESRFNMEIFEAQNVEILESQRALAKGWKSGGGGQKVGGVQRQQLQQESSFMPPSDSVPSRLNATAGKAAAPPGTTGVKDGGGKMKFGWIEGVLIRCMASIFGVMLYLRISWVSGQCGLLMGSCIVLLASLITTITTLSTSAICTNGMVKGGGAYFLISRSLGPEFGGSIGVIFSIANAVAAAMYLVGFAETILDVLKEFGLRILDGDINDIRIIALITCAFIVAVIIVGLSFESKMQIILMVVLWVSVIDFWVGTFLPPSSDKLKRGMTGYKLETIKENLMPSFRDGYNFFKVFAVYFPASTGIMAGANISGDLKDPQKAIPLGTLLAIAITTVTYLSVVWMTGSTTLRYADGIHAPELLLPAWNATKEALVEYVLKPTGGLGAALQKGEELDLIEPSELYYLPPSCRFNHTCEYGLINYFQVVKLNSAIGWLVTAGIIGSTLSSALASMVGAPKVFQAVCRDRLFPYINRFGKGHGPNEEPRQALFLATIIAICIILIGNLNLIAPIISNFFLCSYALINYACFDASFADSPGFRPSFKYYNMYVSLVGAFMCVFVMFIISWWTALITFFFFILIYMYLARRKPDVNWGTSTQAHSYRAALQYVSKLDRTDEHVKNYRPQVLVLTGNPASRVGLVDFAYSITKGNSLLICGYVIPYKATNTVFLMMKKFNQQLRDWFVSRRMKAFAVTVANSTLRGGCQSLLQVAGLGRLRPNILLIGFKSNWNHVERNISGMAELNNYLGMILDAFDLNMSVMILRNSNKGLDISELILQTNEELRIRQEEEDEVDHNQREVLNRRTSGSGKYPVEAHPNQQQSIHSTFSFSPGSTLHTTRETGVSRGGDNDDDELSSNKNPRQRARDILLGKIFGPHYQQSITPSTIQSEFGGAGAYNETLQTTIGQSLAGLTVTTQQTTIGSTPKKARRNPLRFLSTTKVHDGPTGSGRDEAATGGEDLPPMTLPLPSDALRFQTRVKHGTIDVWWLYDDGGLTLLIPYLLTQPKSYLEGAKLRVFTLAGPGKNLQQEHSALVMMLRKFRISCDQVSVIPDIANKKPDVKSLAKFDRLVEPFVYRPGKRHSMSSVSLNSPPRYAKRRLPGSPTALRKSDHDDEDPVEGMITEAELNAQQERTWRQIRIAELMKRYSSGSDLIIVTLPVPRRGMISSALYLAWLEMLTCDLPPTLMLRGNQQSVLTFYS